MIRGIGPKLLGVTCATALAHCSSGSDCRTPIDPPAIEVVAQTRDVVLAASARSLVIAVTVDGKIQEVPVDVGTDLLDGEVVQIVRLSPAPAASFSAEISVRAYQGAGGTGPLLRSGAATLSGDATRCTAAIVDLTLPPGGPPPDGGVIVMERCGDARIGPGETCDDGATARGDGCSPACAIEPGFECKGQPSTCTPLPIEDKFHFRRPIEIPRTSTATPLGGWDGYTLRVAHLDTLALIGAAKLRGDCVDLRVVFSGPSGDVELPRSVIRCGTNDAEVHFRSPSGELQERGQYALWYGRPAATPPPAPGPEDIYLWFDDAQVDRLDRYAHGRFDDWRPDWDDSLTWDAGGFYRYDTGDDFLSGYRFPIEERDVYIEAELNHRDCHLANMTTGLYARGVITSTTPAEETTGHYYFFPRGYQETCQGQSADRYEHDSHLVRASLGRRVGWPETAPPPVATGRWRKMALSVWGDAPTRLRGYDADEGWPSPGWPSVPFVVAGMEDSGLEGGDAGFLTSQDAGAIRNILIRRFVQPEPQPVLGPEEALP
ncbi:MAG: hypothetical protein IT384_11835 [Deltaproteobacteria bacterium]|nr:hypothetical protein [Deltaproteobacteria bacterium]